MLYIMSWPIHKETIYHKAVAIEFRERVLPLQKKILCQ